MEKPKKYIVAGIIGLLTFMFFIIMVGMRSDAGLAGPGVLTTFVVFGAYYAIKSILKSDKKDNEQNNSK